MEINRKELEKASALSDEQLKKLIYEVVLAASGNKTKAQLASGQTELIKEKIKTVTDEELKSLEKTVGPEKMSAIIDAIKKGEKGIG